MPKLKVFAVGVKAGPIVDILAMFSDGNKANAFKDLVGCCDEHYGLYEAELELLDIQPYAPRQSAAPVDPGNSASSRELSRYPYRTEPERSEAATLARTASEAFIAGGIKTQWRHVEDARGLSYVVERLG